MPKEKQQRHNPRVRKHLKRNSTLISFCDFLSPLLEVRCIDSLGAKCDDASNPKDQSLATVLSQSDYSMKFKVIYRIKAVNTRKFYSYSVLKIKVIGLDLGNANASLEVSHGSLAI